MPPKTTSRLIPLAILVGVSWTALLAGIAGWAVWAGRSAMRSSALEEARALLDKDLAFRLWATEHGGVYVPTDDRTPPNPRLAHLPERDIATPSGRRLTLMNPAYMLRQVNHEYPGMSAGNPRVTSLRPLGPENTPDAWEAHALRTFEQGPSEVHEFVEVAGAPHLRMIRPFAADAGCLKCHGDLGQTAADTRGAVSVSLPLTPLVASMRERQWQSTVMLLPLWLVGLAGLGGATAFMRRRERDRARATEALRQSEAKYRTIAEFTSEWEFWIDPGGDWLYCSPACAAVCGRRPEEFLARPDLLLEITVPEDRESLAAHLASHHAREVDACQFQFRVATPSGEMRWIEHHCRPAFTADGAFAGRRGTNRDVTQRTRAELLLIKQRDLARAISTSATLGDTLRACVDAAIAASGLDCGGVYLVQPDGGVDLACHHGLPEDFVHASRHYEPGSSHSLLVLAGQPRYFTRSDLRATALTRQGPNALTTLAVVPITHQDRVVGCLNIASHVLPEVPAWARVALETVAAQVGPVIVREQAQQAVKDSEESLRGFFDAALDLIFVLDENGNVVHVNKAVLTQLGYEEGELLGQSVVIVHPPDRRHEAADVTAAMLAGTSDACRIPLLAKDGRLIPAETVVSAGRWQGRPGLFGVSRNVTEREAAAAELRARNEDLSRFNRAAVGRELRMIELKREVNQLAAQLGQPRRYAEPTSTESEMAS